MKWMLPRWPKQLSLLLALFAGFVLAVATAYPQTPQ